jgi:hypothetical protein
MNYNLTENQKELLRWIIGEIRAGNLDEEFRVVWADRGPILVGYHGISSEIPKMTEGALTALANEALLLCRAHSKISDSGSVDELSRTCEVTCRAYEAVDSDFSAPDTSFAKYLTPLAEVSDYDEEIIKRCLPILGAGGADATLWDSAVRTCGVILEERLREVGGISDPSRIGQTLVNDVFGNQGTLAYKFSVDSERQGYRDLYAGMISVFRNPAAHRIIDPSPQDGGAVIVFFNLLLRLLDDLR